MGGGVKCHSTKRTWGRNVTVVNFHSGRNVQWTFYVGPNVMWLVRGWT
jgi:hypothetical protein